MLIQLLSITFYHTATTTLRNHPRVQRSYRLSLYSILVLKIAIRSSLNTIVVRVRVHLP